MMIVDSTAEMAFLFRIRFFMVGQPCMIVSLYKLLTIFDGFLVFWREKRP
jgi:hypothetical protein